MPLTATTWADLLRRVAESAPVPTLLPPPAPKVDEDEGAPE